MSKHWQFGTACTAAENLLRKYVLQVVIAGVGAKDSPLSELIGYLPNSDCRYGGKLSTSCMLSNTAEHAMFGIDNLVCLSAVYDYQFVNSDGCVFNKLVFLNW